MSYNIDTLRHSMAHVMACAVKNIYPDAKFGIGPAIENGFYYDFEFVETISDDDLPRIQKEMLSILRKGIPFERKEVSREECLVLFKEQKYKLELIKELPANEDITIYKLGDFIDLCRGPHVENTKDLPRNAHRLLNTAGAYWQGDENNPMLQRIYATSWNTKDELKDYLHRLEEAQKRDHRKLGAELELFTFSSGTGKGLPLLLPYGATLRRILERFIIDEEISRGYIHVNTPDMAPLDLYKTSGHWFHYKDSMYPPIEVDGVEYVLRPMACPHHFLIFKSKNRSYRDLPLRYAELASQFRKERSGTLTGLIRMMSFHLSDSHIICRLDQLEKEFSGAVDLAHHALKKLGLIDSISFRASLRDKSKDKYVDDDALWEKSETILFNALDKLGIDYEIGRGEAAFYGPKLDIQIKNVLGKEDTIITVQIDFVMPERFDLKYITSSNTFERPVVVHRSSIGCTERTMAFLIEHYTGAFPLWLAPVQVKILTVVDAVQEYAERIHKKLSNSDIRVEFDLRDETIGKKIREARYMRIPYLLIIGNKEKDTETVTVRNRDTGKQNTIPLEVFVNNIFNEASSRSLQLKVDQSP